MAARFEMRPDGLWRLGAAKDDGAPSRLWVCAAFEILSEVRDGEHGGWGLALRWHDRDGLPHDETFSRSLFAGEGAELRSRLADGGLTLSPRNDSRSALIEFLSAISSDKRSLIVPRVGWHTLAGRRVFVLPDETIGGASEQVLLASQREPSLFGQGGTLEGWRAEIGARCAGNSRLLLAACCGFAGPLLDLLGAEGGGIHLFGKSRAGKTTLLLIAASVAGGTAESGAASFVRTWRSTGNAIEATAAAHSDALLPLDEIGQAAAGDIGETAYLLGNGQGKARMDRSAGLRPPLRFRVLFLSTGELTLAAKIAEAGKTMRAGMENRMIDLPAEAGAHGVFEAWPIDGSPEALAQALADAARRQFGTPLRAFLRHLLTLVEDEPAAIAGLRGEIEKLVALWVPPAADGQVRSVARRFSTIAQAGELATAAGLTGWVVGEATRGVRACFAAWLAARGGVGARENMQAAEALRRFIQLHGSGRFADWRDLETHAGDGSALPLPERMRVLNRAGFRRWDADAPGSPRYRLFLLSEGMREALAGLAFRPALAALKDGGLIVPGSDGRSSQSMTVPGYGKVRLYEVSGDILGEDQDGAPAPPGGA